MKPPAPVRSTGLILLLGMYTLVGPVRPVLETAHGRSGGLEPLQQVLGLSVYAPGLMALAGALPTAMSVGGHSEAYLLWQSYGPSLLPPVPGGMTPDLSSGGRPSVPEPGAGYRSGAGMPESPDRVPLAFGYQICPQGP